MGAARVVVTLLPEAADKTLPVLDRWPDLIPPGTRCSIRCKTATPYPRWRSLRPAWSGSYRRVARAAFAA
jgi:hypothetical protein